MVCARLAPAGAMDVAMDAAPTAEEQLEELQHSMRCLSVKSPERARRPLRRVQAAPAKHRREPKATSPKCFVDRAGAIMTTCGAPAAARPLKYLAMLVDAAQPRRAYDDMDLELAPKVLPAVQTLATLTFVSV
eukprot:TRINITY_DN1613_c0_g1_i1.p2 TRINITY_DN1613_c0_g1~~TRINITY_DN1613_c0_g1_i1.p2  ORF type:complete len:133 (+),score=31.19 TRINITY_DN1613_c0_g1_i1:52-450(+)